MTCTLTIQFNTPGYNNGHDSASFSVPDGSYVSPYIEYRTDLGYNSTSNNVYTVYCNGSQGIINLATYYPGSIHVTIDSSTNSCPPVITYDCINGVCIPSTQYKTAGIYNSLANCQAVCANGGACASGKQCVDPTTFCPDGKVCIDQSEFASIEALISKINSEVC